MARSARWRGIAARASSSEATTRTVWKWRSREAASAAAACGSLCTTTAVSGSMGNPPSSAAPQSGRANPRLLLLRRAGLLGSFKRLGLKFPVLLEQDLDLALGRLQLLAAGAGELDAFFEQRQRLVERDIALFQLVHDLFQAREALFELGQGFAPSAAYFTAEWRERRRVSFPQG